MKKTARKTAPIARNNTEGLEVTARLEWKETAEAGNTRLGLIDWIEHQRVQILEGEEGETSLSADDLAAVLTELGYTGPQTVRVVVTVSRGIPTVYANTRDIDLTVIDEDTDDASAHDAARAHIALIEADTKAGKLFQIG